MKTVGEIRAKLVDLVAEYDHIKEWYNKASEKYQKDKDYWGRDQADRAEMDYASDELSKCGHKIHILKWVLDEEEKTEGGGL